MRILKNNGVRLITYVPGNVLTPLMVDVSADNYFLPVVAPREDEAIRAILRSPAAGS
jgi:sulfopyruvate decarboxylase TPP-binding subunit